MKFKTLLAAVAITQTLVGCGLTANNTVQPLQPIVIDNSAAYQLLVRNHEKSVNWTGTVHQLTKQIDGDKIQFTKASFQQSTQSYSLDFAHSWHSAIAFESPQGVDLTPYLANGVLSLDMQVNNTQKAALNLVMHCGENCVGKLRLREWAQQYDGLGWQQLNIPLSCFIQADNDVSNIQQVFTVEGDGVGEVEFKNIHINTDKTANFSCPDAASLSTTPGILNEYWAVDWWIDRHQEKLQANKQGVELVLIGDSITHGWEKEGAEVWQQNFADINTLNLGFSGDRTENVLWRLNQGELDGAKPKLIQIMLGTNNTGHRMEKPEYVAKGIRAVLDKLKQITPDSQVLILAIFPRGKDQTDMARQNNQAINLLLKQLADEYQAEFANINSVFLTENGQLTEQIMPDLLHPNARGYALWAEQLQPYVERYIRNLR